MTFKYPIEWGLAIGSDYVIDPKADIVDGPFGSNLKASEYTDEGEPIARIQNVKRFRFIDKNIRYVTPAKAEELQRHSFKAGDILITKLGDPLGLACEVPLTFNQGIIVADLVRFRANEDICSKKFLVYLLNSEVVIKQIEQHVKGTTRPRINLGVIRGLHLPFPSLMEQKVIAEKLDTLLAQVETTKAHLESTLETLKQFRQSVLAAAVSGKLTEDWRNEASDKWLDVKLLDVIVEKPRNGKSPKGVEYETAYKNLTLSATTTGKFIEGQFKYVELELDSDSYLWLKKGDILIQRANSIEYVGVSAIYDGDDNKYVYPDLMMKCRPNNKVLGKYLHLSLSSETVRRYFRNNATGTSGNMPKINQKIVSEAPILLPPIDEQAEIVRCVEKLFAGADITEQQVNQALERVNSLTQSILAKAFRGELTEQWRKDNPDLISGDNSAEALLKKIKAEREAVKPKRKTKK